MVDNSNPTNQFHPYQPATATPHSERTPSGVSDMLRRVGIDERKLPSKMRNMDVRGTLNKARDYARGNPGMMLGGLAALVIGAGLMRKRSMTPRE